MCRNIPFPRTPLSRCLALPLKSLVCTDSLKCYDAEWWSWFSLVLVVLVFFSAGTPLYMALLLYKNRHDLYFPDGKVRKHPYNVFYQVYHARAYWWETVQMTFKVLLWGTLSLFRYRSAIQLAVALILSVVQLSLHIYFRPFGGETLAPQVANFLQTGTFIVTVYIAFGGMVTNYLVVLRDYENLVPGPVGSENNVDEYTRQIETVNTIMQTLTFLQIVCLLGAAIVGRLHRGAQKLHEAIGKGSLQQWVSSTAQRSFRSSGSRSFRSSAREKYGEKKSRSDGSLRSRSTPGTKKSKSDEYEIGHSALEMVTEEKTKELRVKSESEEAALMLDHNGLKRLNSSKNIEELSEV